MPKYKYSVYSISLLLAGCTSLSEGQGPLPPAPAMERITLEPNAGQSLPEQMNNQASEINRKRNIEQSNWDGPAMTPESQRPQLLPLAPVDSSRHNIYWPWRPARPLPPENQP